MPELPEVETVKRGLDRLIVGKTITSVTHDTPKSFPNSVTEVDQFLINAQILSIQRRAKVLLINLSSHYTLIIHLKMTGQLVYRGDQMFGAGHPNSSLVGVLPDRSTRVVIEFSDGSKLFFNDQRKFGWVRLHPTVEVPNIPFMLKFGPEPLTDNFSLYDFIHRFAKRKRSSIKAALLDQTVVAGIGNIYADEALFAAKIHPSSHVQIVTQKQFRELYHQMRAVMNLSIEKGGSTDKNYVDAEGKKGSYLTFANVFRREGQPCRVCGTEITKLRVAGRGTHVCPNCQVLPK